jgi:uncharacterized Zn-binding protein involved in type VI secretion
MHVCPMSTGPVPHVGGIIVGPGSPTVLIGGMPAAVMGDMCICTGPPDSIILGSTGVFIGGKPAARMGDQCAHGGSIILGCMTVLIGEISSQVTLVMMSQALLDAKASLSPAVVQTITQVIAMKKAAEAGSAFAEQTKIEEDKPAPPEKIEKGNLDFALLDDEDNPIEGVNYEVKLPDGNIRKGKTDKDGKVSLKGIPTGSSDVSFPELDQSEWG